MTLSSSFCGIFGYQNLWAFVPAFFVMHQMHQQETQERVLT